MVLIKRSSERNFFKCHSRVNWEFQLHIFNFEHGKCFNLDFNLEWQLSFLAPQDAFYTSSNLEIHPVQFRPLVAATALHPSEMEFVRYLKLRLCERIKCKSPSSSTERLPHEKVWKCAGLPVNKSRQGYRKTREPDTLLLLTRTHTDERGRRHSVAVTFLSKYI